jgi:hypothetical protein
MRLGPLTVAQFQRTVVDAVKFVFHLNCKYFLVYVALLRSFCSFAPERVDLPTLTIRGECE